MYNSIRLGEGLSEEKNAIHEHDPFAFMRSVKGRKAIEGVYFLRERIGLKPQAPIGKN